MGEIADTLGKNRSTTRLIFQNMRFDRQLVATGKGYTLMDSNKSNEYREQDEPHEQREQELRLPDTLSTVHDRNNDVNRINSDKVDKHR